MCPAQSVLTSSLVHSVAVGVYLEHLDFWVAFPTSLSWEWKDSGAGQLVSAAWSPLLDEECQREGVEYIPACLRQKKQRAQHPDDQTNGIRQPHRKEEFWEPKSSEEDGEETDDSMSDLYPREWEPWCHPWPQGSCLVNCLLVSLHCCLMLVCQRHLTSSSWESLGFRKAYHHQIRNSHC